MPSSGRWMQCASSHLEEGGCNSATFNIQLSSITNSLRMSSFALFQPAGSVELLESVPGRGGSDLLWRRSPWSVTVRGELLQTHLKDIKQELESECVKPLPGVNSAARGRVCWGSFFLNLFSLSF